MAAPRTVGKYQILDLLGKGGMGEVYKAYQPDLDRHVAIKLMIAGEHASEELIRRFQREAQVAGKLSHPNIVPVYDFGSEGKLYYFVMELVDGRTLKELIASKGIGVERAVGIAVDVARALEAAHEMGVVHRDIKPGNIMIDAKGRVRVTDFGLAKVASDGSLTTSGAVLGTPNYMAPEQARASLDAVSPRTDIYALGAVLYEMLAGRPPFHADSPMAVLRRLATEEAGPPSKRNPAVGAPLDAIVMCALAKDPAGRFASARAFADALAGLQGGTSATAAPATPAKPRWLARIAVVGIALLAGLAIWMIARRRPAADAVERANALIREAGQADAAMRRRKLEDALTLLQGVSAAARLRADLHRHLGRYGKAAAELEPLAPTDPEARYRRVFDQLASNPFRWAVFGLLGDVNADALRQHAAATAEPARKALLLALASLYEGQVDAAHRKLEDALALGPPARDAAFVRAEIELHAALRSGGEPGAAIGALDAALGPGAHDLSALRAVTLALKRDAAAARAESDRLIEAAPDAAESYLVRVLIDLCEQDWADARSHFDRAARLGAPDARPIGAYIDALDLFGRHAAPDEAKTRELVQALGGSEAPLAHLLRGWLAVMRLEWDEAAARLKRMAGTAPFGARQFYPWELQQLADALQSRARLLAAGRDILAVFERGGDARAVGKLALGASGEFEGEERAAFERDGHFHLARLFVGVDRKAVLGHVAEALARGGRVGDIRGEEAFKPLLDDEEFKALLRRHDR